MVQTSKVVFFGTSEFGVVVLEKLVQAGYRPALVVTTQDKPAGRGLKLTPPPVKVAALELGIPLVQPGSLSDFRLSVPAPDLFVVASYGNILPKDILAIPPKGTLNVHPSLLPKYRGPSPVHTAILNGDHNTGVTIMLLDEKMDHGPVLAQQECPIAQETFPVLRDKLAELGAQLLIETIPGWVEGKIRAISQNDTEATYTKTFKKEDGKIDWNQPAARIERQIRAFTPWPGTHTFWNSKLLKILKARAITIPGDFQHKDTGEVFLVDGQFVVATKEQALLVEEVQLEGGKPVRSRDFLLGHKDFINSTLDQV